MHIRVIKRRKNRTIFRMHEDISLPTPHDRNTPSRPLTARELQAHDSI